MLTRATRFAALAAVRHAAHHLGDYWVQTDHQAQRKGDQGRDGAIACAAHVAGYTATNLAAIAAANRVLGLGLTVRGFTDEHVFLGNTADVKRQIGNAVPVGIAHWLGTRVAAALTNTTHRAA